MTSKSQVFFAQLTLMGTAFFAFVMFVAFLIIQPDLNPLYRFGSEYAVGRFGWLMKLAFFIWGIGLFAFAVAMYNGLDATARSIAAVVLFVMGAIGIFFSGVWDSDLQLLNDAPPPHWVEGPSSPENDLHNLAGFVGLLSLIAGAGFASRRLRVSNRLQGRYRALRVISWLLPLAFVSFAAFFVPYGLAGLGQRIFLLLLFAWILIAARGLARGAFLPNA